MIRNEKVLNLKSIADQIKKTKIPLIDGSFVIKHFTKVGKKHVSRKQKF